MSLSQPCRLSLVACCRAVRAEVRTGEQPQYIATQEMGNRLAISMSRIPNGTALRQHLVGRRVSIEGVRHDANESWKLWNLPPRSMRAHANGFDGPTRTAS